MYHVPFKSKYFFLCILIIITSCKNRSELDPQITLTTGKVVSIIDGDTYDLLINDNTTMRIRMEGIDAPEKGMPFYHVSKTYLGNLCKDQKIRLEVTGKDSHGRTLAYSYLPDGRELSHEMIKVGLAWHFNKYNSDPVLATLEIEARKAKIGLWIDDDPMSPWENRSLHSQGVSTKDSFDIRQGRD